MKEKTIARLKELKELYKDNVALALVEASFFGEALKVIEELQKELDSCRIQLNQIEK